MGVGQAVWTGFALGVGVSQAVPRLISRYINWRMNRDYLASIARLEGCPHAAHAWQKVGTGLDGRPVWMRKCLQCWGIWDEWPPIPGYETLTPHWTPNSVSPQSLHKRGLLSYTEPRCILSQDSLE